MTTQYTPILKLALPVTGELSGTWGTVVNDNITSMVEQAVAGLSTINTWTANAHTLTTADGTSSEARCAMLVLATGAGGTALTAAGEVICPAASKLYVVKNGSAYAVTVKTSAGTGVAIPAGDTAFVFCDGTNVNACVTTIVNGHISGNLTVDGNTTLGDATSDTITATARFNTDLLPSTDNARDLGSTANSWRTLYCETSVIAANITISGNTISSTDTNGNITLAPNGTGDVQLDADTIRVGDSGANVTITSNGAGDLILNTNSGTNSGSITIEDGVNGNIALAPNGTGQVTISTALDLTNLEVTNIKAKDGTASMTLADTTGNVTFSKATVIETTDNTNAALRVTQLGTGNAILVEDSANPDSTPFVVTAAGDVGVGASSPGYALDVQKSVANGVVANFQSTSTSAVNTGVAFRSSASNAANRNWALLANSSAFGDFVIRTSTTNGGDPVSGTDRLMIDPSGNLGLGGVTPVSALGFGQAASATGITFQSTSTTFNSGKAAVIKASISGSGNGALIFETYEGGSGGGERMRLTNTGTLNIVGAGTAGSTQAISFNGSTPVDTLVTDSSGRVGIGTNNPGTKLAVNGTSAFGTGFASADISNSRPTYVRSSDNNSLISFQSSSTSGDGFLVGMAGAEPRLQVTNNLPLLFLTNNTERMRLDSSGNLGLGVTPSAKLEIYSTNNAFNALQVRYNGSNDAMGFGIGNSNGFPYLGYNTKSQASVDAPVYERSNPAAQLRMDNGSFKFNIAPSGTANTTTITNLVSYTIITSGNQTDFGAANNNVGTVFTANASGTLSSGTVSQNISFTQAMTLDASGRLLVGLTADTAAGGYFGIIQAQGSYPAIVLKGTETSAKTWQIGENAGSLAFYNTTDGERARITSGGDFRVKGAGTAGSTDAFQISGSAPADAARLTSGGDLLVGTTTSSAKVSLQYSGASAIGQDINDADDQANSTFVQFRVQGTQAGTIKRVASTSAVVYNTTSDYRLKNVVGAVTGQGSRIDALKPIDYQWKQGNTPARGFLAHEFQEVYPSSVSGTKDAVDAEGKPVYQAMQASTSEVIADLVAELQSLRARVAQLEQGV